MPVPIVLAAFGTTTGACALYDLVNRGLKQCFPAHPLLWSFSSRMVRDRRCATDGVGSDSPSTALTRLGNAGHSWAVLQSLHLLPGHEFDRLVFEAGTVPIRTSIGLPLLYDPDDFRLLAEGLALVAGDDPEEALLLIGHGTDHPAWTAYPALEGLIRRRFGPRAFVGVMEGFPCREEVVSSLVAAGYRRAYLVPLLLAGGYHLRRDLFGGEDSWLAALRDAGLAVRAREEGLAGLPVVVDLLTRHIAAALDIIPENIENHD